MIKSNLKPGDVLSESSHYIVENVHDNTAHVKHFESGDSTIIAVDYLKKYANSADTYTEVVEVTKEDKRDGTPGIRSIFEGIHSQQAFTVCFKKQDKPKSKKAYDEEVATIVSNFSEEIDAVKNSKKIQFVSRDGRYDCVDMDIEKTDKESGIRPVNINTIKWLIYDGIKYVVK